jgi:hypothetical protein
MENELKKFTWTTKLHSNVINEVLRMTSIPIAIGIRLPSSDLFISPTNLTQATKKLQIKTKYT